MIEVGALADFRPRSVTVVSAGGVEVGVVRWDDDAVYALQNVCPHALGPVCAGRLGPKIVAAAGDPMALDVDETCPVIACAWHGWEFDVRSGHAIWPDGRMRVKTYATRIEDGRVLVAVDRAGGRTGSDRPDSLRVREVEAVLDQLVRWAAPRDDVRALALVGSWAAGAPRGDSDVDVVLLTDTPAAYIERDDWLPGVGAAVS